ncbi:MAG: HAMP domain-containing histidine kinase [Rhodocyclaceae bacterium]|nr:HAMP domain-containing histidine kinase [Rhodocyclaceae bacterium]
MELSILNGWLKGGRSGAAADGGAETAPTAVDAASRPAEQSPDRFRLLKWFAAASFVAVMMVIAAFAAVLSHFVGEAILRHDATLTSEFIGNLADTEVLHGGMIGQLTLGQILDPHFDADRFDVSAERAAAARAEFLSHVAMLPDVVMVKVYSRDRELVWSTAVGELGQMEDSNSELERAFQQKKLTVNHSFSPFRDEVRRMDHRYEGGAGGYFVEEYIPLFDMNGEVASVVEVYKQPKSLRQTLFTGKLLVWALALFSGVVLFGALVWIARRGERLIDQQQARLIDAENLMVIGEMSAAVAHGIRNPLAAIRSSAELAMDSDGACLKRNLESIIRQSDRLGRWLKELLVYAGPINSHSDEAVDVGAVVHECLAGMRTQMEKQRVDVVLTQRGEVAPVISGSRAVVSQLAHTVLSNALEAMPRGGMLRVTIDAQFGRRPLRLVVEDSGPGMTSEQMEQIFKPFFTTKSTGLGIGLPLARRIIDRLGGDIAFTSRLGAGTRVEITFGNPEAGSE